MRKAISGMFMLLILTGVLSSAFNIQLAKAESETVRIDNLIVTTSDLEAAAIRLAQWKNSCGIPSKVLTTTWIYSHYSGIDEPEKIRNCIKDFHSNFLTRYVTIFGDVDKVPIRYAYVPDGHETFVPTDLYYADLDYSWDDNGDGLYADLNNDRVDGVPDVYVGRIPASFSDTAENVVTKIIEYQQSFDVSEDWVNRFVLAAGVDGDITVALSEYIYNVVRDKDVVKLYEPEGNLTKDALNFEIDRGCIFLNFAGHSGTLLPGITPDSWILRPIYTGPIFWDYEKYSWQDALSRRNGRRLPVIVTISCSSAKVDWTSPLGTGECLGEYFVMNPNGGAIAYFGPTGIAWGSSLPYGLMPELDRRIYEAFYSGHTRLGDMWGVAITEYVQRNALNTRHSGGYYLDEKTVAEFILLGDPTLRIYNGPETLKVPEEYATIQGAINSAYRGDTIEVAEGNYHEHIVINKTVSLIGESRYGTVILGDGTGTVVYVLANNVNITGFAITNGYIGIETDWRYHQKVNVIWNIIDHNTIGVKLYEVYNSTFSDNYVSYNNYCGILLINNFPNLSNNTIINNVIWHNGYGIWMDNSDGNTIYHNNFINNKQQVRIDWGNNTFDDGYPSGGNYWSDRTGGDLYGGPYQNETGSDGICDTPYVIDASNIDRYPLMNPWGSGTPFADFVWSPSAPEVNELVTFDASASKPIGGEIISYEWNFGDGSSASGKIVTHIYATVGTFTVTLNITDSEGLWAIEQKRIEVKAPPPPLTVTVSPSSASILLGQSVTFNSTVFGGYPPYNYQWYLNENPVPDGTLPVWTFTPVTGGTFYTYLKVTDAKNNTAQSENAIIYVAIVAIIDIKPDTFNLNLKSKSKWITAYIELPEGYNVSDVNISSILLNGTIPVDMSAPTAIGDFDNDGVPDLMVKFNRSAVCQLILSKGVMVGNVTLSVSGKLANGIGFEGCDTIRVRMPGDINMDGKVDTKDISIICKAFGSFPNHPRWNPIADENEDNKIDIADIALTCKNFGKTYK
jgi:parallel beta-helix repeat protein